jgi:hypothetical protein
MQVVASTSRVAFGKQCRAKAVKSAPRISSSRRLSVAVRAGTEYDRDTGFVQEDNSGRSNIFPRKQQAYIKSNTSDAAASQGLGGFQGGVLLGVVVVAVLAATVLTSKAPGPETLQTVGDALQGDSLSAIAQRIQASI